MKINEAFDRYYLLNLNRDIVRFDNMLNVFKHVGLDNVYKWCGNTPTIFHKYNELLNNVVLKNSHYQMTPQYLACLNSHLSIIRDAYDNGAESVLIMEDDIIPIINFEERFEAFYDDIEALGQWDMLYLAYIRLDKQKLKWDYINFGDDIITDNVIITNHFWSCMAYALSRKVMRVVLDFYENNYPMEIDRFFVEYIQSDKDNYKTYGAHPQLFAGVDNYSNNTNQEEEIFARSAGLNHNRKDLFYNPQDFSLIYLKDVVIKTPFVNFTEKLGSMTLYQSIHEYYLYTAPKDIDLLVSCEDAPNGITPHLNYNISNILSQLPDDWVILVLDSTQPNWTNTLSISNKLYISDDVTDWKSFIINRKYLTLFNHNDVKDFTLKEYMARLKTDSDADGTLFKNRIYHVYPNQKLLRNDLKDLNSI